MKTSLEIIAREVADSSRRGRPLAFFFDYDGTLTPFVAQPDEARLSAIAVSVLARLAAARCVCVSIISGRSLDNLKKMVGLAQLNYAGTSGLELEIKGGRWTHPKAAEGARFIEKLAGALASTVSMTGAWIERKPIGLTVHYRALKADLVEPLREAILGMVGSVDGAFRVVNGAFAIEITPDFGWTKGNAVRQLLQNAAPEAFPIYAGDEANDEEAMKFVVAQGGVAIAVGPRRMPATQYRLPAPGQLLTWLGVLADELAVRKVPPKLETTLHEP
jgi:trehalose-phosphatase